MQRVVIRLLDLALSTALLVFLAPIMIVISLAILVDSGRPVFFRQSRVGKDGKTFSMYKFRSMRQDAEKSGPHYTRPDDHRITRVGYLLRKTSLDEIPQLWNVLIGDMSLVGPRPLLPSQINQMEAGIVAVRSSVRPGITGLAQVRGRSDRPMEFRVKDDLEYVANRSVLLNIEIIARTLVYVVLGKGTN